MEKDYLLGFTTADGCLTDQKGCRMLHLFSSDKEHLVQVVKSVGLEKDPRRQSGVWAVTTARKDMVDPLFAAGLTTQKAYNLGPLVVGDFKDFLRGYCDGDGSIGLNRNRPTLAYGAKREEFLTWLQAEIHKKIPGAKMHLSEKNQRGHKWYSLQGSGENIIPVLRFMYEGASLALKRKADLARAWL